MRNSLQSHTTEKLLLGFAPKSKMPVSTVDADIGGLLKFCFLIVICSTPS